MSDVPKKMVFGSMGAAALVAVAALVDIFLKVPFAGRTMMDVFFIIGAAIVIYLGWDAYQDLK